jgi:hypothetical protein
MTVFQDETRNPERIEPLGNVFAFMRRKPAIPATGANNNRRSSRNTFLREEWRQSGNIRAFSPNRTGRSFRPEQHGGSFLGADIGRKKDGHDGSCNKQTEDSHGFAPWHRGLGGNSLESL